MATAPIYCTHKELKRVFPQINEFDGKKQIYNWIKQTDMTAGGVTTDDLDLYYSQNCGLITQLYYDGVEMSSFSETQVALLNGAAQSSAATLTLDGSHGVEVGDIVKIGNEYLYAAVVSTNDITFIRGCFNTQTVDLADDTPVYLVINISEYPATTTTTGSNTPLFYYNDTDLDLVFMIVDGGATAGSDPNDHLMEAGEDFIGLVTQFRTDASRYLDSRLDPNLPKEQLKDKSGNFDYIIIRTTALICAAFMIRTKDPNSEMAESFMAEAESNISALNNGEAALSWQNTSDASKGIIRDVTYTSGKIRPVDTKGRWNGTWDLIKVKIDTSDVIGTATFSVWAKDSDGLKNNKIIDAEKITGDYQSISSGLSIRFAGQSDASTTAANDEWEIEVTGWQQEVDSSSLKPIRLTRKYR